MSSRSNRCWWKSGGASPVPLCPNTSCCHFASEHCWHGGLLQGSLPRDPTRAQAAHFLPLLLAPSLTTRISLGLHSSWSEDLKNHQYKENRDRASSAREKAESPEANPLSVSSWEAPRYRHFWSGSSEDQGRCLGQIGRDASIECIDHLSQVLYFLMMWYFGAFLIGRDCHSQGSVIPRESKHCLRMQSSNTNRSVPVPSATAFPGWATMPCQVLLCSREHDSYPN